MVMMQNAATMAQMARNRNAISTKFLKNATGPVRPADLIHERLRRCVTQVGDVSRLLRVIGRAVEAAGLEAQIHERARQRVGQLLPVLDDPGEQADVDDLAGELDDDMVIAQRPQRRRPHDAQDDEHVEKPGDIALDEAKAAVDRVDVLVGHVIDQIGAVIQG